LKTINNENQKDLWGNPVPIQMDEKQLRRSRRNADGSFKNNPLILLYGTTEGEICKDCENLYRRERTNKWYKCSLRRCSGSPVTDHRVNWPACGKFVKREGELQICYLH